MILSNRLRKGIGMEYEVDKYLDSIREDDLEDRINKGYMALVWCICENTNVDEAIQLFGL